MHTVMFVSALFTVAGILRRTSIELGSGTVSFDVSLLSDLTSYQKSTMTSLQVTTPSTTPTPSCLPVDANCTCVERHVVYMSD